MELTPQPLVIVALWIIWCFSHSLMITPVVTTYLKAKLGDGFRFYRLLFNIVSLATLCPLAIYSFQLKERPVWVWDGALVVVQYGLLALSAFLFLAGARHYSLPSFLGLAQIRGGESIQTLSKRPVFATSGILGVMRHPWYADYFLFGRETLARRLYSQISYSVCIWLSERFWKSANSLASSVMNTANTKTESRCCFPGSGSKRNCIFRHNSDRGRIFLKKLSLPACSLHSRLGPITAIRGKCPTPCTPSDRSCPNRPLRAKKPQKIV